MTENLTKKAKPKRNPTLMDCYHSSRRLLCLESLLLLVSHLVTGRMNRLQFGSIIMALRPNYSLVGQGLRLGFVVFIVVHVLISAWLVIDFEGEYTDGAPAPTRIDAIAVIDDEETLIDVKMERSTSFILYMLYRDYDSSYGVNETTDEDNSTVIPSEQQNEDKEDSSSSNDSETDWLKIGRNTTFAFMILLVASEILMFFTFKFRSAIRFLCWFGLILCFTVIMPTTYVIDLDWTTMMKKKTMISPMKNPCQKKTLSIALNQDLWHTKNTPLKAN